MSTFHKTDCVSLQKNPFSLIGKQWMLVCAGKDTNNFNMMTASWGGLGWFWERPVAFIVIRPQRYTLEFVEREEIFTLSFFPDAYRMILSMLGKQSGRDFDKIHKSGLTPFVTSQHSVAFQEAELIFECKKWMKTVIKEEHFVNSFIPDTYYPHKDFHHVFIAEITATWTAEKNHLSQHQAD